MRKSYENAKNTGRIAIYMRKSYENANKHRPNRDTLRSNTIDVRTKKTLAPGKDTDSIAVMSRYTRATDVHSGTRATNFRPGWFHDLGQQTGGRLG